eukprot:15333512-Ditylum_brightwellii.AAC.1
MATAAAVASYGAYRIGTWAWNTWRHGSTSHPSSEEEEEIEFTGNIENIQSKNQLQTQQQLQKYQTMVRIKRCNSETIRALTDFLPSLRKSIFNSTDLSQPTKMLKKIRLEKRQLQQHLEEDDNGDDVEQQLELLQLKEEKQWDILKNRSLTRVITTAYAHVHLLGGRLFRDEFEQQRRELIEDDSPKDETSSTTPASTSESSSSYRESHRIVLTRTYERFLSESVSNLAKDVEDLAEDVLRHWHVMGADDDDRKTNENEIYHDNEEKNCTDIT